MRPNQTRLERDEHDIERQCGTMSSVKLTSNNPPRDHLPTTFTPAQVTRLGRQQGESRVHCQGTSPSLLPAGGTRAGRVTLLAMPSCLFLRRSLLWMRICSNIYLYSLLPMFVRLNIILYLLLAMSICLFLPCSLFHVIVYLIVYFCELAIPSSLFLHFFFTSPVCLFKYLPLSSPCNAFLFLSSSFFTLNFV